jgi:plastocyanin
MTGGGIGRWWPRVALLAAVAAFVAGCATVRTAETTTVLVDYDHDEFATQFIRYFPERIQAHPGDTITFRQTWTGEAHTVTLGTLVQDVLNVTRPLIEEYAHLPDEEIPPEVFEAYFAAEGSLPLFYSDEEEGGDVPGEVSQVMAQPCLVEDGVLPEEGPCPEQDLPPFDGTEAYYNSGIIPFEGPAGNVFELELAEDIAPGEYHFYCAVHGSFHSGTIEVVPADEPIPPPAEVSTRTREEINRLVQPLREAFEEAQEGRFVYGGTTHTGNFAGLVHDDVPGLLNEFIPRTLEVDVDEPVTWRMFGPHSISFDVPEYFPIVEFLDDGTVRFNEELWPPAGGAPEPPEDPDPDAPLVIDGGTYDGDGFWSSGVLWSGDHVEYTLRFSEPGTYRYACLIHPPMVGEVRVRE